MGFLDKVKATTVAVATLATGTPGKADVKGAAINAGAQTIVQTANGTSPTEVAKIESIKAADDATGGNLTKGKNAVADPKKTARDAGTQAGDQLTNGKVTQGEKVVADPATAAKDTGTQFVDAKTGGKATQATTAVNDPTKAAKDAGTQIADQKTGGTASKALNAAANPTATATQVGKDVATNQVVQAVPGLNATPGGGELINKGVNKGIDVTVDASKKTWGFVKGVAKGEGTHDVLQEHDPKTLHMSNQPGVKTFVEKALEGLNKTSIADNSDKDLLAAMNGYFVEKNKTLTDDKKLSALKSFDDLTPKHLAEIFQDAVNKDLLDKPSKKDPNTTLRDEWDKVREEIKLDSRNKYSAVEPAEKSNTLVASTAPAPKGHTV